jgi:serine/threonine-protein kinase
MPSIPIGEASAIATVAIPDYLLEQRLHRTTYGDVAISVMHGRNEHNGREVAVKLMVGARPGSQPLQVFQRMAAIWGAIRHARVVQVIEDRSSYRTPFIVMEYFRRGSLESVLRALRGRLLVPDESIRIVHHIAQALEELGRRRLLHRAIQPSNILCADDGSYKLSDFFLVKELQQVDPEAQMTGAGRVKGASPYYMAPEQFLGMPDIDERVDLYQLGCVLFQLLSGQPPHVDIVNQYDGKYGYIGQVLMQTPPPPFPGDPNAILPGIDHIVGKLLQPLPQGRYQSASELLQDLAACGIY